MDLMPDKNRIHFLDVFYAYETDEKNYYNIVTISSFILFNVNALIFLPKLAPRSAKKTPEQLWKWRNIANSLIHSILSGFGAMIKFVQFSF